MIFLGSEWKDFRVLLNPTNLKAFNTRELLSLASKLMKSKDISPDRDKLAELSEGLGNSVKDKGLFTLRYYFYQIYDDAPMVLDLRDSRIDQTDGLYFLKQTRLVHDFSPQFKEGLRELYEAFYLLDTPDLIPALSKLRLSPSGWPEAKKKELESLFLSHFQKGDISAQVFQTKDMVSSFSKIFSFLKDNQVTVPSEFALLGIGITGLYLNLSQTNTAYDVAGVFKWISSKFN